NPEIAYGMALSAAGLKQNDKARALFSRLAPADGVGYGPAHLWWARHTLAVSAPAPDADKRAGIRLHLRHALEAGLENPASAHALLADFLFIDGELDQAEAHLLKAVPTLPHVRLRLAQVYQRRGARDLARVEAQLVAEAFAPQARRD